VRLRAAYWGQDRRPRSGDEVDLFEFTLGELLDGGVSEPDGFWRVTLDGHDWLLLVFGETGVLHHVEGETSEMRFLGPLAGATYVERVTGRDGRHRLDAEFDHSRLPGSKPLTLSVELDGETQPELQALRDRLKKWASS